MTEVNTVFYFYMVTKPFYLAGLGDCKFDIKKSLIPPTRNVYKSQSQPFFFFLITRFHFQHKLHIEDFALHNTFY